MNVSTLVELQQRTEASIASYRTLASPTFTLDDMCDAYVQGFKCAMSDKYDDQDIEFCVSVIKGCFIK